MRFELQLLRILKSENVTERLLEFHPESEPDNGQFETTCDALTIKLCRPQTLELAGRYSCDRERVAGFLIRYEFLFAHDGRLI
jgi:hypothetical protein